MLVDNSSPSRTGGYIPPRAHILVQVAQYDTYLASRSALMCLTPSLPFPRPRLVPFPAPHLVPRPRHSPRAGIPSPPCILLSVRRHVPPRLVSRLGLSGRNPQLPIITFHVMSLVTPSLLARPPLHSPHARFLGIFPSPRYWFPPPHPHTPALPPSPPSVLFSPHHHADSPAILPHPRNRHDKHSTSCPDRSRSPTTPSRPKKRAASTSSHVAHGTVPGSWSGTQLVSALRSIFGCDYHLRRMPGSGLHRQVKVLWRNHRLAVNIWGTGRVHIHGKGASHFAQLLLTANDLSLHSDPQPQQSPVLSESPPVTGSDLPGQAGSSISYIVDFVSGILSVCLCFRVSALFASFCRFMGSFGFSLLGTAVSFNSCLLGRVMKWLLKNLFLRRWSRHRHKRIRGIGSQAASRRGAKSRRLAFASKARSFSGLAHFSHWRNCFQPPFARDQMSRQRSLIW